MNSNKIILNRIILKPSLNILRTEKVFFLLRQSIERYDDIVKSSFRYDQALIRIIDAATMCHLVAAKCSTESAIQLSMLFVAASTSGPIQMR